MEKRSCPECGADLAPGDQTCDACGEPLSFDPDETGVPCRVCGEVITAYTETCPGCGESGYPALRPRTGKVAEASPETEAEKAEEEDEKGEED